MRVLCVIPARYASTRLPGKPLIEVGGVPLVMWTYRQALSAGCFDEICIATDDERIVAAVEYHGGRAMLTSSAHESGTDRALEVSLSSSCTHVVNLQGDEPRVPLEVLQVFCDGLSKLDNNGLLTIVSHATIEHMANPSVVKAVLSTDSNALYFSRSPIPYDRDAGKGVEGFRHAGIYGFTRESLQKFCGLPQGSLERAEKLEQLRALENGMNIRCLVKDFDSIGVDTPGDLELFRAMIEQEATE